MTISHPRIEVKDAAAAGWFGAREEAQLPVRGAERGSHPDAVGASAAAAGERGARVWVRRVRRIVFDLAIVVAAMTAVPVWTISAAHGAFWQSWLKTRYSLGPVRETEARAFMVPADPAITPIEAGRSYLALLGPQPSADFPEPDAVHSTTTWPRLVVPSTMYRYDSRGRRYLPNGWELLQAAPGGFSSEGLDYLKNLSAPNRWRDFDRVARAQAMDVVGARFRLPFLAGATIWTMPRVGYGAFQSAAELEIRRAAYHLAIGQRDSAEAVLRLIVSFGLRAGDNAPTISDQLASRSIVRTGMDALERFYVITHDPRAAAVRATLPGAQSASTESRSLPGRDAVTAEQVRNELIQRADDPHELRGIRFASLELLSTAPCTNVRELLFGPRADVRDAFARAKRDLARYPSEQAFIDLIQRAPNSNTLGENDVSSPMRQFLVGASTIAGAVLHNPRLAGCTLIATGEGFR